MRSLSLVTLLVALHFSQAINVYLSPQSAINYDTLSSQHASNAISTHLGLEAFESFLDASKSQSQQKAFIGKGPRNALLLTINEEDAESVLPSSLQLSFKLSNAYNIPGDSLLPVIHTYLRRASYIFPSTFGDDQLEDVDSLTSFFETRETPSFAAVETSKLSNLRQIYGSRSHEYLKVANETRRFLEFINRKSDTLHMALLTFSTSSPSLSPRETRPQELESQSPKGRPPPQEPIGSVSTCFSSKDSCSHATNSCSGRGRCLEATKAGRTCFVCACHVTRTGEGSKLKTDTWVGQSCERKDISSPFVLLSGTVVVLVLLVFGSVSLLSGVGDKELPSTLLATAVHVKKD